MPDKATPEAAQLPLTTPEDKKMSDAAQRKQRRLDRMKQRTVLSDCVVMLRYALDESCRLPTTLIDDIAKIDAILVAAGDEPLSQRPESLIPKPEFPKTPAEAAKSFAEAALPQPISPQAQTGGAKTPPEAAVQPQTGPPQVPVESQSSPSIDQLLLSVHNALSDLVAPATALSLRATDPELAWFGMPPIVQGALVGAVLFMMWFLICVPKPELQKPKEQTSGQTPKTPIPSSPQTTPSASPINP